MASDFEQLIGLWEDGARRIAELEPSGQRASEAVVAELTLELRRRLGGRFTTNELAAYYLREGTDWCFQIACRVAPGTPEVWDMTLVAGAAFARYAHAAADYGGGILHYDEE